MFLFVPLTTKGEVRTTSNDNRDPSTLPPHPPPYPHLLYLPPLRPAPLPLSLFHDITHAPYSTSNHLQDPLNLHLQQQHLSLLNLNRSIIQTCLHFPITLSRPSPLGAYPPDASQIGTRTATASLHSSVWLRSRMSKWRTSWAEVRRDTSCEFLTSGLLILSFRRATIAQKRLRELKSRISAQSKRNFVLERDVRFLDSRIGLLIQNRMALDEVCRLLSCLTWYMEYMWCCGLF